MSAPGADGRVLGTLVLPGLRAPMAGHVAGGVLTVEELNGASVAGNLGAIAARMRGPRLVLTIVKRNALPVTISMERSGAGGDNATPAADVR